MLVLERKTQLHHHQSIPKFLLRHYPVARRNRGEKYGNGETYLRTRIPTECDATFKSNQVRNPTNGYHCPLQPFQQGSVRYSRFTPGYRPKCANTGVWYPSAPFRSCKTRSADVTTGC